MKFGFHIHIYIFLGFFEHRTFDLLFGVVVFKSSRYLGKVGLNGLGTQKSTVPVPQTVLKSDSIAVQNADGIPNVVTAAFDRKKDQILSVDPNPNKVSDHPLRRFRIPLLRQHCLAGSPTATTDIAKPVKDIATHGNSRL